MNPEKKEHVENGLFRARKDLSVMNKLAEEGIETYISTICFHAQQAVEKFLKAFLAYRDLKQNWFNC